MEKYNELLTGLEEISEKYDISIRTEIEVEHGQTTINTETFCISADEKTNTDSLISDIQELISHIKDFTINVTILQYNSDKLDIFKYPFED
jgi:hypothetical protein